MQSLVPLGPDKFHVVVLVNVKFPSSYVCSSENSGYKEIGFTCCNNFRELSLKKKTAFKSWDSLIKAFVLQPNQMQQLPTLLGQQCWEACCVRLHLDKLFATTPNIKQQHATKCNRVPCKQTQHVTSNLLANNVALTVCTGRPFELLYFVLLLKNCFAFFSISQRTFLFKYTKKQPTS